MRCESVTAGHLQSTVSKLFRTRPFLGVGSGHARLAAFPSPSSVMYYKPPCLSKFNVLMTWGICWRKEGDLLSESAPRVGYIVGIVPSKYLPLTHSAVQNRTVWSGVGCARWCMSPQPRKLAARKKNLISGL